MHIIMCMYRNCIIINVYCQVPIFSQFFYFYLVSIQVL